MGKPGDGANTANGRAEGAREPRVADGVRKPLLGGWGKTTVGLGDGARILRMVERVMVHENHDIRWPNDPAKWRILVQISGNASLDHHARDSLMQAFVGKTARSGPRALSSFSRPGSWREL